MGSLWCPGTTGTISAVTAIKEFQVKKGTQNAWISHTQGWWPLTWMMLSSKAVEAVRGQDGRSSTTSTWLMMVLATVKWFLTWRCCHSVAKRGGMVAKWALEQWNLLEASRTGLRGCGRVVMYHHVLCKFSLHARQHFDKVLLWNWKLILFNVLRTFKFVIGALSKFQILTQPLCLWHVYEKGFKVG